MLQTGISDVFERRKSLLYGRRDGYEHDNVGEIQVTHDGSTHQPILVTLSAHKRCDEDGKSSEEGNIVDLCVESRDNEADVKSNHPADTVLYQIDVLIAVGAQKFKYPKQQNQT